MAVLTFDIDNQRRDFDVADEIARYVPDVTQWAVLLMRARKRPTGSAQFFWYDEDVYISWTQINNASGYNESATQLVVDDARFVAPKDLIKVPRTGEVMFVTSVDLATNTITVVRGYSGTAAASLNDNDWMHRMGNAMEENSLSPQPKLKQPDKFWNYVQEVRTPFDESDTSAAEDKKTRENERQRLRRSKAIDHRLDIERISLFGVPYEDTSNNRRTTGGIESYIKTNVIDFTAAGGVMTEDDLEEQVLEPIFAYGSGRKLIVASPRVASVINRYGRDKIEVRNGSETYGMRLRFYKSFHGDVGLVVSRVLEQTYASWAFVLDMDYIYYRPLRGRDTKLRANIQENDRDGWKDEYMTKFGMEVRLEKAHAIIKGVTKAAS